MTGTLKDFKNSLEDIQGKSLQKESTIEETLVERKLKVIEAEKKSLEKRKQAYYNLQIEGKDVEEVSRKEIRDINNILQDLKGKEIEEQFVLLVDKAITDLSRINTWVSKESNFNNIDTATTQRLNFALKFLDTYSKLDEQGFAKDDTDLQNLLGELNKNLGDISYWLPIRMNEHFSHLIKDNTKDPNYSSIDSIHKHLKEAKDITSATALTGAMGMSTDKILSTIDKLYKKRLQEVLKRNEEFKELLFSKVKDLKKSGVSDFKWMVDSKNAMVVQKQSLKYNKDLSEIKNTLKDSEGNTYKYHYNEPSSLKELTKEQREFNIDLYNKKSVLSDFLKAENIDYRTGKVSDGENKKYTSEFKNKRSEYEVFDKRVNEWVKKKGVSENQYLLYLEKYYTDPVEFFKPIKEKIGKSYFFTGTVEKVTKRFVRDKFIETTEKWDSTDWKNIQKHSAKKAFYDFYMKEFNRALDKLPSNVSKDMQGRLPAISKHYLDLLSKSEHKFKTVTKSVKNYLTPDHILSHRQIDENGNLMDSIPILFTNSLQNQDNILNLEKEIKDITTKMGEESSPSKKRELYKAREDKKKLLRIETRKLEASEVSTDLESSLVGFVNMAENYEVMSAFDSTVNVAKEIASNRQYYKTKPNGELVLDNEGNPIPASDRHKEPLVVKRLTDWMQMVLYNNVETNNSVIAQVAMKAMNYVSIKNLGLNIFSGVNNAVIGEIVQRIEAWGGQFYTRKNYRESTKEFAKYASTYFLKERSYLGQDGMYGELKPEHKISAFMHEWDILQDTTQYEASGKSKRTGIQKTFDLDFMFAFTNIGEYSNQARSAMSVMKNTPITDKFGNASNLWDAHDFVDGKFKLKDSYTLTEEQKFEIKNKIIGLNQYLHGRYTKEDQAALQKHYLGKMLYHFKKWVVPGIEARYKKRWYDERLGVEMEGRYRTLAMFLQASVRLQGGLKNTWNELSPMEKANMKRNAAELSYLAASIAGYVLFSSLAGEVDDDDELLKKSVNFLVYQSSRQVSELSTFFSPVEAYNAVKNPVATLGIVGEISEFLASLIKVPYNYLVGEEDKNYYERGIYKDNWKVGKEANDIIPILTLLNRVRRLSEEQDYFIK
jgi:hypothetical protein